MTDYTTVQKALEDGADPAMLCATCPWDRYCVNPPSMTRAEIDAKIAQAGAEDDRDYVQAVAAGKNPGMPTRSLLTAITFAGKDTAGALCPVFALRLRSSSGRGIADTLKDVMQKWDDGQ